MPAAAGVLARALADDPGWVYLFPDDATRVARMTRMLRCMLAGAYVPQDASLHVPGAAAAIWTPPGGHDLTLGVALRVALPLAFMLGRASARAVRLFRAMEGRVPDEPHYYLAILGVDPAQQGRGLGLAVCAPVLARCDESRTLAWLESTNPRNHSFYRRRGFEVAAATAIADGPTFTFFAREPR